MKKNKLSLTVFIIALGFALISCTAGDPMLPPDTQISILRVNLGITHPANGQIPVTSAAAVTTGIGANYTVQAVYWDGNPDVFSGGTEYRVTITVRASEGFRFIETTSGIINGETAERSLQGLYLSFAYTFPKTDTRLITSVNITKQPNLSYTHGDLLDLSAMEVMITFDDLSAELSTFSEFPRRGLSTNPANNTQIVFLQHNNLTVKIMNGNTQAAQTDALTVSRRDVIIIGVTALDKHWDGTNAATLDTSYAEIIYKVADDNVTIKDGTGVFSNTDVADNIPVIITGFELEGPDAPNYFLTKQPVVTGNIKRRPLEEVNINITIPVTGAEASTSVTTAQTEYSAVLSWYPSHSSFLSGVVYTATIVLTVGGNFTFNGLPDESVRVNGQPPLNITNDDYTLEIVVVFSGTAVLGITSLQLVGSMQTAYIHGDTIDFTGLTGTIVYQGQSPTTGLNVAALIDAGVTIDPPPGTILSWDTDRNKPITFTVGSINETSGTLTVHPRVTLRRNTVSLYSGTNATITTATLLYDIHPTTAVSAVNLNWQSSNTNIATVNNAGLVTKGTEDRGRAIITVTDTNGISSAAANVLITPLTAMFSNIAAFLTAAKEFYVVCDSPHTNHDYFFGSCPDARGDNVLTEVVSGTVTNITGGNVTGVSDFNPGALSAVIHWDYDFDLFGRSGPNNLTPRFSPAARSNINSYGQPTMNPVQPYRTNSGGTRVGLPHFAFTHFRALPPWGNDFGIITQNQFHGFQRVGLAWSTSSVTHNPNTVRYNGIAVDLGRDTWIDTVVIYALISVNPDGTVRYIVNDGTERSIESITIDYLPAGIPNNVFVNNDTAGFAAFNETTGHNRASEAGAARWVPGGQTNNPPAAAADNWRLAPSGPIFPDSTPNSVFVFHFETPVLARYVRASFRQAHPQSPQTPTLVGAFEIYNTKDPTGLTSGQ